MFDIVLLLIVVVIICTIAYFLMITYDMINNMKRIMEIINNKSISLSMNLSNNLTNSINIGTSIGDFVANVYNAVGIYDLTGQTYFIEFDKLFNMFTFWSANNDYTNILFKSDNYNRNKLYTLPCYLADIYINSNRYMNNYEIFGEALSFGYKIEIVGTVNNKITVISNTKDTPFDEQNEKNIFDNIARLQITKINNAYCRLELDETSFIKYINKFFQFVYDTLLTDKLIENNVTNVKDTLLCKSIPENNKVIYKQITNNVTYYCLTFNDNLELFEYYQYFVLIYRLKKEFYNASTNDVAGSDAYNKSIYKYLIKKEYEIVYIDDSNSKETARFYIDHYEAKDKQLIIKKVY